MKPIMNPANFDKLRIINASIERLLIANDGCLEQLKTLQKQINLNAAVLKEIGIVIDLLGQIDE